MSGSAQLPDHVPSMFGLLPPNVRSMVLVGSNGSGALVARYRRSYPSSFVHLLAAEASLTSPEQPDAAHAADPGTAPAALFDRLRLADCWVFDGTLEALAAPHAVLRQIHRAMPPDASLVLRVANAQHWRRRAALATGAFSYGVALPTDHLRQYTRDTLFALLADTAFQPAAGAGLNDTLPDEATAAALRAAARAAGTDPDRALADALPASYLIRAVPV